MVSPRDPSTTFCVVRNKCFVYSDILHILEYFIYWTDMLPWPMLDMFSGFLLLRHKWFEKNFDPPAMVISYRLVV